MNDGMMRSWILIALAALAVAADKPKETWCIGPITALDAKTGLFTITVKSQGQSVQTQTNGPRFLGSFIVASSSAASEEQRTFQCAPLCRFATPAQPAGATLGNFKTGDSVLVTCAGTNAPWVALQVSLHATAPARR
jgi:hypothetical protein